MNKAFSAKNEGAPLLPSLLYGAASFLIVSAALAAVSSFIALGLDNPHGYTGVFSCASLFCAAFAGGFSAARKKGSATLLCGALTGAFSLALIALGALLLSVPQNLSLFAFRAPCVIVCSVLGACVGVGSRSRPGKKKKKYRKNRTL